MTYTRYIRLIEELVSDPVIANMLQDSFDKYCNPDSEYAYQYEVIGNKGEVVRCTMHYTDYEVGYSVPHNWVKIEETKVLAHTRGQED